MKMNSVLFVVVFFYLSVISPSDQLPPKRREIKGDKDATMPGKIPPVCKNVFRAPPVA